MQQARSVSASRFQPHSVLRMAVLRQATQQSMQIQLTCALVPKHGMALAKGAPLAVLSCQPHIIVTSVEAPAQWC